MPLKVVECVYRLRDGMEMATLIASVSSPFRRMNGKLEVITRGAITEKQSELFSE